jgi:hypothetical protein
VKKKIVYTVAQIEDHIMNLKMRLAEAQAEKPRAADRIFSAEDAVMQIYRFDEYVRKIEEIEKLNSRLETALVLLATSKVEI